MKNNQDTKITASETSTLNKEKLKNVYKDGNGNLKYFDKCAELKKILKISSYFFNFGLRLNLKVFIDFIEHPTDFMYNTMLFASFFTDLEA